MQQETFAPPALDTARKHIRALLDAYRDATGLPATFIGIVAVGGDPKFARTFETSNFSFGVYDRLVARLSAVWPEGVEWPADVPRQPPAKVEPQVLEELAARLARIAAGQAPTQKEKV